MNLSLFGVKWPVTTAMIFLSAILLGAFSWTQLGLDLMPDFEIPVVSVITTYSGCGPKEIESSITEPIEESVSTVENVDEILSVSNEGVSMVTVKFNWGVDLGVATNDIRDKLDLVSRRLPDNADKPYIFKFNMSMIPVAVLSVTANESWEKLEKIVDRKIIDSLKRVTGVATAIQMGGDKRGILVDLDRERLQATGLTGPRIVNLLNNQNLDSPGGTIKHGIFEYLARTPGRFTRVDDLKSVVVATTPGVVRLGDVAEIRDDFLEKSNDFLIKGKRGIGVMVQKQSGTNTVKVAAAVREAIVELQKQLPPDVQIDMVMDSSEFIQSTIKNLTDSVLLGGVGVFLVILFFLRDIRGSMIICTTIPTSLISTFLLMYMAGYTLNQISLSSLAIAIGMVVDNSIVILDNIKRYLDRGVNRREAAISGAMEMGTSVMASNMTTIVIFLPIIFTSGLTNIMFGQLAMIVTMTLSSSLLGALMLTPMLCSKFLQPAPIVDNKIQTTPFPLMESLENQYASMLESVLKHPFLLLTVLCTLLVFSLGLVKRSGTDFMPVQDQGRITIKYECPVGTRFEVTGEKGQQIAEIVKNNVPELKNYFVRFGKSSGQGGAMSGSKNFSYAGQVSVNLVSKDKRKRGVQDVVTQLRPLIENIPGITVTFDAGDPMANMMGAGGAGFTLHLYGHDLTTGMDWAKELKEKLSTIEGLADLEINQDLAQPELQIIVDREKAATLGFNVSDIGKTVETYINGDSTVKFQEGGDEYDIVVRLRPADRDKVEDLGQVPLVTSTGQVVRLRNVAEIRPELGPTSVTRHEQERYIKITGQVYGRGSGDVSADAQEIIDSIPVPPGFSWKFAGNEEERQESFFALLRAGVLGGILVFMVMASQFESLLAPFIIALSIPFGFIGAVFSLLLVGAKISVVSLLGFLILIGIVVNNGIVMVSFINILIQRKVPLWQALIETGRNRLRPILSTTATTILGMLPMAFSRGEGSEVWVPMGTSVIGGLVVSTLTTLFLMPTLYMLLRRWLIPANHPD